MFEKDGSTRLSKTAGSPAFMAPEMLIGRMPFFLNRQLLTCLCLSAEPGGTIKYEAKVSCLGRKKGMNKASFLCSHSIFGLWESHCTVGSMAR